jgi:predicted nucleic acid-binding protein
MIVVSDTGPLNYLLRLEAIEVLPHFYSSVMLTPDKCSPDLQSGD